MLNTTAGDFEARFLINCAGLYSDRVARMNSVRPHATIVPFRGEYYQLKPERTHGVGAKKHEKSNETEDQRHRGRHYKQLE